MNRTLMLLAAAAGLALARPALATDDADTTKTSGETGATATTTNEAKPPALPATASERARWVHENIAFGKNGEEERAEHRHAKATKADVDHDKADTDDARKKADLDDAKKACHDALADKADMPEKRPTLPSTASERAGFVHDNIAFGKHGEAERAAHRQADKQGGADADDAHSDMANRAAHGEAADAQRMMDDGHSAASQERDHHDGMPSSNTSPMMPKGGHR